MNMVTYYNRQPSRCRLLSERLPGASFLRLVKQWAAAAYARNVSLLVVEVPNCPVWQLPGEKNRRSGFSGQGFGVPRRHSASFCGSGHGGNTTGIVNHIHM